MDALESKSMVAPPFAAAMKSAAMGWTAAGGAAAGVADTAGVAAAADALGRQLSLRDAHASLIPTNSPAGTTLPPQPALQAQQCLRAGPAGPSQATPLPPASQLQNRLLGRFLAPAQAAVPAVPSAQPQLAAPSLQDRFAYLDPIDGSKEYGPCLLEHLLHWCSQGSLPPHTKVWRAHPLGELQALLAFRGRGWTLQWQAERCLPSKQLQAWLLAPPDPAPNEFASASSLLLSLTASPLPCPALPAQVRPEGSSAWLDLALVQHCIATGSPLPAPPSAGAPLSPQDCYLYLDPKGSGEQHGPCTLEQLLFWCSKGHLATDTKV